MTDIAMKSVLYVTKALADVQRIRILMLLRDGELCVCQIVEVLDLAPSTISKHLSILTAAGLADFRKEGRWAHYRIPEGAAGRFAQPVSKWLEGSLKDDAMIKEDAAKLRKVLACDPEAICKRQRRKT